jgi:hypothetical protein
VSTTRGIASAGAALLCALALPAAADAAMLVNGSGALRYTGDADRDSVDVYAQDGIVRVFTWNDVEVVSGCTQVRQGGGFGTDLGAPNEFQCAHVAAVGLDGGDGDDGLRAHLTLPTTLLGGPGDDDLQARPEHAVMGGTGIDVVAFTLALGSATRFTLSGLEGIEDVRVAGERLSVTLEGDEHTNVLEGSSGNDVLRGGAGADTLQGHGGDDRIDARDGFPDLVSCGAGTDTADVDLYDQVGRDCERVRVRHVPAAGEDRPPQVRLSVRRGHLHARATDDRGVRRVRFLAGGRTVCVDRRAPFTCAFASRGETIVAIAVDSSGQTATAIS